MKQRGMRWHTLALISFATGMMATTAYAAAPKCTDLATNPAYGLAGNPVIAAAAATLVPASVTPAHAAYCNVQITYSARSGPASGYAPGEAQAIKIGIGLPLNGTDGGSGGVQGAWNGKLENLGGGGLVGSVGATTSATDIGYIGTSTDTGHTTADNGTRGNFGVIQASQQLDLGKINDYIYEGVHQQVEWGKTLAKTYYGTPVTRNYWNGCSTGGRQGFALAQQHGEEFDGFLVGAPAFYHEQFRFSDAWPALMVREKLTAIGKTLTTAQFTAATASAVAACDAADGVSDGLIDDPRSCKFSAAANICGKAGAPATPNCLDADQAATIDAIWDGPRNHLGKRIWFPFDRGAAIGVGFATLPSSAAQVISWDHRDLTFNTDLLYSSQAAIAAAAHPAGAYTYEDEATLGANNTDDLTETQDIDLDRVKHHGGKIIMWQGASDQLIRWRDSIDYYTRVAVRYGHGEADFRHLQSWFRYYHAPGVAHCGGGTGPQPVNLFGALVNWVENGVAPDSILSQGGAVPTRTRPLCPWPSTAIYNGAGSTDDAANFHCGGNLDAKPAAACQMLRTPYKHENQGALDANAIDIEPGECHELDHRSADRHHDEHDDHGFGHDFDDDHDHRVASDDRD
jgi:feruloyl esterase